MLLFVPTVRPVVLVLALVLAGCPGASSEGNYDPGDLGDDSGSGGAPPRASCATDDDCALAATTCCACPSFATGADDPSVTGCDDVGCPTQPECPANVRAACLPTSECGLACVEMTCETSCPEGFAIDPGTGCLSCACAPAAANGCVEDTDCARTRQDCCGCDAGGTDTAVLATDRAAYDAALGCDGAEACPGVSVCEAAAAPRCASGACILTSASLPAQACTRAADCPNPGDRCVVNRNPDASLLGVGVCAAP